MAIFIMKLCITTVSSVLRRNSIVMDGSSRRWKRHGISFFRNVHENGLPLKRTETTPFWTFSGCYEHGFRPVVRKTGKRSKQIGISEFTLYSRIVCVRISWNSSIHTSHVQDTARHGQLMSNCIAFSVKTETLDNRIEAHTFFKSKFQK